jgi:hypothetical protein
LEEISGYIATDNPEAAERVRQIILASMSLLTELENLLIRISTKMPALRAFKKLCVSPRPPRLCVYPDFSCARRVKFSLRAGSSPKIII